MSGDIETTATPEIEDENSGDVKKAPCNIVFLSIPPASLDTPLTGYAARIIKESDATLVLNFGGKLMDYVRRQGPQNLMSLSDSRNLDSDTERELFSLVNYDISTIGLALDDIRVSKVPTGSAWALGLRPLIFRELYAAHRLRRVLEEGHRSIVVVSSAISIVEKAVLSRLINLQRNGDVIVNGVGQIKKGLVETVNVADIMTIRAKLAKRRHNLELTAAPFNVETLAGDFSAIKGEQPSPADVLLLHLTDNAMFHQNVIPVLDELQRRKVNAAVLMSGGFSTELYKGRKLAEKWNVASVNQKFEIKDAEQSERIHKSIQDRIEVSCLSLSTPISWAPLIAAHSQSYMNRTINQLLTFHTAFNVMIGRTRATSVYMTQSPDTNPLAYLAVAACGARARPFYSFSSFLNASERTLPFVAPAILLAGGQHEIDILKRRNSDTAAEASVVGIPALDALIEANKDDERVRLLNALDVSERRPIVTILTSRASPEDEDPWIARIMRWAESQDIDIVLARTNRSGTKDLTLFKNMAKNKGWDHVSTLEDSNLINAALMSSDVVVTNQPSLVYSAISTGVPIIQASINDDSVMPVEKGVGFTVTSEVELQDILSSALLDDGYIPEDIQERRNMFLSRLNDSSSETAAQRIVQKFLDTEGVVSFEPPFIEKLMPGRFPSEIFGSINSANFNDV
ncbi:hypothetical protein [Hellea balneolensis]|uniref:hypothetical protein n=1 Tax=Hellea balneolensis TaxID=287478 RepID=UPI0003FFA650|nr:hypothetical protein [Hellea balneolensis]